MVLQARGSWLFGLLVLASAPALADVPPPAPLFANRFSAREDYRPNPQDVLIGAALNEAPAGSLPIYLAGAASGGRAGASRGGLRLALDHPNGIYALLHSRSLAGHFYAEVGFDHDDSAGLILVRDRDGRPDPGNFTSIMVETDAAGKVVVHVRDRENGRDNVLDCTRKDPASPNWWRKQTRLVLDRGFSVPASHTAGRFRIFHDTVGGVFRFYFAIRPQIAGEPCSGFIELSPSPLWNGASDRWFVGPCVWTSERAPTSATFHDLRAVRVPTHDRDDRTTGFAVTRRDCNWSGYWGEALVVTFGPESPLHAGDRKFLFWSAANFFPLWELDNQYCPAFGNNETWGGETRPGACFEPMSDRLLRYSSAQVLEDNAVRKVIRWHYAQIDPDYVPYGFRQGGTQLSYSDEDWIFYPDGSILRRDRYYPCLDTRQPPHPLGVKLFQADVVTGSQSLPEDYLEPQCLSVLDLEDHRIDLTWPGKDGDFSPPKGWKSVIVSVHSRKEGMPDTFNAYSQDPDAPGLFANPPMDLLSVWHRTHFWRFSHWPFDAEPYMWASNSQIEGRGQATHCSLFHIGANADLGWRQQYSSDPANNRKYREWVSLHGLADRRDYSAMRARTASWLRGGAVQTVAPCRFTGYDPKQMEHVIDAGGTSAPIVLSISPAPLGPALINPVLRVDHWRRQPQSVAIGGKPLRFGADFRAAVQDGSALLWLNRTIDAPVQVRVE